MAWTEIVNLRSVRNDNVLLYAASHGLKLAIDTLDTITVLMQSLIYFFIRFAC